MPISRRTQAALARVLANMSHAYLDTLAFEFGVEGRAGGYTREQKAVNTVRAIAETSIDEATLTECTVDLATRVLGELRVNSLTDGGEARALIAALELDGYTYSNGRVAPQYPGPVALMQPVSWLEDALGRKGLQVAATHFRQSVDNFERGNWESCNGQLRSFFENLLLSAGTACGKQFKDPSSVIQHLSQVGELDDSEQQAAKALWGSLQDNGAHAGLSDEEESLHRLHSVAAWARYMISRGVLGAA